ncbi:DUF6390 family protein [Patescibacteria group bacterium]
MKNNQGLKLAAIYSYPPSRLGFCGKKTKNTAQLISDYLTGKNKQQEKIKKVLTAFEAAYPYLKLIAKANNLSPFNKKVVEAFWLGNSLLLQVKVSDLKAMVLKEFTKQGLLSKKEALTRIAKIRPNSKPHHSFHVFVLGPVTGRIKFNLKLYDLCRISWAKIIRIYGRDYQVYGGTKKIVVKYQPIISKNNKFTLGKEVEKQVYWNKRFIKTLKPGDLVALHWDIICQKIDKGKINSLQKFTLLSMNSTSNTGIKSPN